jgi:endonuclease/exonuclease/phosphatase family metal-dependent hydrolase
MDTTAGPRLKRARRLAAPLAVAVLSLLPATGAAAAAPPATPRPGPALPALALVAEQDQTAPVVAGVSPSGPHAVTVTWKSAPGATGYRVNAAIGDSAAAEVTADAGAQDTSRRLTGLHAATGQQIRVWVEADDEQWTTSSASLTTLLTPGTVRQVEISAIFQDGATLAWPVTANASSYEVQLAADKQFRQGVVTERVEGHQRLKLRKLAPGTRHYVRVRAMAGDVAGKYSPATTFDTRPARPDFVTLRFGTWNVCSQACDGYSTRAPIAAQRIADAAVDVFALQEAGGKKVAPVTDAIFGRGQNGYVRAAGGDERGYLFYKAAKYTQNSGGHVALGDDRHMSWAQLTDNSSGISFVVGGIHLLSGRDKVDAQRASQTRIALSALRSVSGGLPVALAGDFNSGPHRGKDTPSALLTDAGFRDTRAVSKTPPVGAEYNTAHTWDPSNIMKHADHIDRIMVTGQFEVEGWKQLLYLTGNRYTTPMVSDHNAITADITVRR